MKLCVNKSHLFEVLLKLYMQKINKDGEILVAPQILCYMSIYIAQPNPALRRPVLLLLCGARDMCSCHDAWPSSRPLPQQVNIVRSGGLGRPCFVGQASRLLRSPCLLIISVFFGCFCSFAGRWPARHDSQCPHDVSFIFHLSITCRHSRTN